MNEIAMGLEILDFAGVRSNLCKSLLVEKEGSLAF